MQIKAQYELNLNVLTVDNGLSQNVVYDFCQDSRGFLWIATNDGLNRYDGFQIISFFASFDDSTKLGDGQIRVIKQKDEKHLWIGTVSNGISVLQLNNLTFSRLGKAFDLNNNRGISISSIYDIIQTPKNDWFIVAKEGLFFYDENENRLLLKKGRISGEHYYDGYAISDNELLLFNSDFSLKTYSISENTFRTLDIPFKKNENAVLTHSQINANQYVTAFENRLYTFDINSKKIIDSLLLEFDITEVFFNENQVWVGGYDMMVVEVPISKQNQFGKPIQINKSFLDITRVSTVRSIKATKEGVIWIGTNGAGISNVKQRSGDFKLLQYRENSNNTLLNESIRSILPLDTTRVLIGGYSGLELYHLDEGITEILFKRNSENKQKFDVIPYHLSRLSKTDSMIYIGTEGSGLVLMNLKTKQFSQIKMDGGYSENFIRTVAKMNDDYLLLGTSAGLKIYSISLRTIESIQSPNEVITSISDRVNESNYIGTESGSIYVMKRNKKREKGNSIQKISQLKTSVLSLFIYQNKEIWVGTTSGLLRMDFSGNLIKKYNRENGLSNNTIYGMLEDSNGKIWMSTNNGLNSFSPKQERFSQFQKFKGLQSNEFNRNAYAKMENGALFFGGINGVSYFKGEHVFKEKISYPVYIEKVKSGNTIYYTTLNSKIGSSDGNRFEFEYLERDIQLFFSSPIFDQIGSTSTYYRIENGQNTWTLVSNPNMLNMQLSPGDYEIELIHSDPESFQEAPKSSVLITIIPPFYVQIWFQMLIVLLILFILGSFTLIKVREFQREKVLAQNYTHQLIQFQENERKRVANVLHDSLGSKMMLIKMSFKQYRNLKTLETQEIKSNEINQLISDTIQEIREISHNLHPHLLEKLGLTKTIESLFDSVVSMVPIQISCTISSIDSYLSADESLYLYRFIQESLTNVLRHSKAKTCSFELCELDSTLGKGWVCRISDDGIGIDLQNIDTINQSFGIRSMTEIADYLKAKITFNSTKNKGTSIELVKKME